MHNESNPPTVNRAMRRGGQARAEPQRSGPRLGFGVCRRAGEGSSLFWAASVFWTIPIASRMLYFRKSGFPT